MSDPKLYNQVVKLQAIAEMLLENVTGIKNRLEAATPPASRKGRKKEASYTCAMKRRAFLKVAK